MKKILILLIITVMTAVLMVSCSEDDGADTNTTTTAPSPKERTITVTYAVDGGGKIVGETQQTITTPLVMHTFEMVEAVPDEGYAFMGWSDGGTAPKRSDTLNESATYTAIFKKKHRITFTTDGHGHINGNTSQSVADGRGTYPVTAIAAPGYKFVGWSNGATTPKISIVATEDTQLTAIFEVQPLTLPILSINTENGDPILSKEIYVNCQFSVSNTDDEYKLSAEPGKIKGRGNTSWKNDKKPYHIKFDEPVDLFGNGEAREWNLISNHTDYSMIRNYLAYTVASKFSTLGGLGEMQFVELYLNGQYDGVYLVCERIEIAENRVNITTSEPGVLDTGYIVELDGRGEGDCFAVNGKYYAMKAPENYTKEQKNYIGMYVYDCLNALENGDWEDICNLIDVESFAESYIVHEVHKCCDVGYASFYMVKDSGGKLRCGPVWDFDRSLGNVYNKAGSQDPKKLFASIENEWFAALLKHEEFVQLVGEKLDIYAPIMEETYEECFAYVESHKSSFERNDLRWSILGRDLYPNPSNLVKIKTWQGQVDYNKQFLKDSLKFMLETYPA
ncbi:MAG: CotH kinase family protein [Clostridia bacterium]|nr:CotH kinase family protein [Clostridia bacterium]